MDQLILSVAGRDFFIDQDCHWDVSMREARCWAAAHGASAVRLSRRRAEPGCAWGAAQVLADIPLAELAGGSERLRRRAGAGGAVR